MGGKIIPLAKERPGSLDQSLQTAVENRSIELKPNTR